MNDHSVRLIEGNQEEEEEEAAQADRRKSGRLKIFTKGYMLRHLDAVIGAVILLNTVTLGMSIDLSPDWNGWKYIEGAFV
eukprot:10587572-Heterocapsa_arctica.AAC.1